MPDFPHPADNQAGPQKEAVKGWEEGGCVNNNLNIKSSASSLFEKRGKDLSLGEKLYAKYAKWKSMYI